MSSPGDKAKENKLYRQLQDLIEKESSKASFACGGSIPITNSSTAKAKAQSSAPINLFWASASDEAAHKLTLPESSAKSSVEQLAKDCTLASFGRGGEDVIDTSYRQAGKLDITQFASTFHPADFGLLENIEQILVPDLGKKAKDDTHSRKLITELYKLNVYSGPSGHFRNHVDTPRSPNQIGSLVVCLPAAFKGGNLLVRHGGRNVDFDWSPSSQSTIQWAAFYSDCEHEIKTVATGHRITLTYNLHLVDVVGGAIKLPKQIVDPDSLAPYDLIRSMLEQEFMTEGGILGIYCSHAYAHTSKEAAKTLPRNLKGSDLVIYSIFQSLGFEVSIRPVLQEPFNFEYEDEMMDEDIDREESGAERESDAEKRSTRQENVKRMKEERENEKRRRQTINFVGTKLHPHSDNNSYEMTLAEEVQKVRDWWPNDSIGNIVWLTSPKHSKKALTYLAYGNESSIDWKYSCAAILVTIPSWKDRQSKGTKRPRSGK